MNHLSIHEQYKHYRGAIEIITKDRHGNIIDHRSEPNLIKIFAKEMLSHRLPYSKVWVPDASSGGGAWEASDIDPNEEYAAKYILFGASYDVDGQPLNTADTRFYTLDAVTGQYIPKTPNVGADNGGDLINPIPISEPDRPLKRIETISFRSSYQPADTPLLDSSVRALDNVVALETILKLNEYNGFGTSAGDFFTITEIALASGRAIDSIGSCECTPKRLFLEGVGGSNDVSILASAGGTATVTIDGSVTPTDVNRIKEGDQIYLVAANGGTAATGTEIYDELDQVNPYYLVISKSTGGHDIVLDRTPTDSDGTNLTGSIGLYRNSLRIFSSRILSNPFKKSDIVEITVRWLIYFA